jgi:hypothetical protein
LEVVVLVPRQFSAIHTSHRDDHLYLGDWRSFVLNF